MVEKRRGLGRGLGALIPSAPEEPNSAHAQDLDAPDIDAPDVEAQDDEAVLARNRVTRGRDTDAARADGTRPADIFFERVTPEDQATSPRSYSTALKSGIDKNIRAAQTKKGAKASDRKSADQKPGETKRSDPRSSSEAKRGSNDARDDRRAANPPADPAEFTETDYSHVSETRTGEPLEQTIAELRRERAAATREDSPRRSSTFEEPAGDERDRASPRPSLDGTQATNDAGSAGALGALSRAHRHVDDVSRETPGSSVSEVAATPDADAEVDSTVGSNRLIAVPGASFAEIDVKVIQPNRKQPRVEFDADELDELIQSIRQVGVLQPVVVRPSQEDGSIIYELVMGERRWRASMEAGLSTIPAIIRSTHDDDLLRDALLENLHRSALNPLEEAAAYQQLLDDFGCSHDELAGRLGRSRPQISNTLRLLRLPPMVQRRVAGGVLSAGHARALLGLPDPAAMEHLAQRIVSEGLSVRSTEELVAVASGLRPVTRPIKAPTTARHERLDYIASSLADRLDTTVKISLGAKKGRVSIEFASVDDLNRIIGVITPSSD